MLGGLEYNIENLEKIAVSKIYITEPPHEALPKNLTYLFIFQALKKPKLS
jgi:hypothetical protein